jgi:hypothetical protein
MKFKFFKKAVCLISTISLINGVNLNGSIAQDGQWVPTSDHTTFYDPNFKWMPSQPNILNLKVLQLDDSGVNFVWSIYVNCTNKNISYRQSDGYYQGVLRDSKTYEFDFYYPSDDPVMMGIVNKICQGR